MISILLFLLSNKDFLNLPLKFNFVDLMFLFVFHKGSDCSLYKLLRSVLIRISNVRAVDFWRLLGECNSSLVMVCFPF